MKIPWFRKENVVNIPWVTIGPVRTWRDSILYKFMSVLPNIFLAHISYIHDLHVILSVNWGEGQKRTTPLGPYVWEAYTPPLHLYTDLPKSQKSYRLLFQVPNSYPANTTSMMWYFICVCVQEGWILFFLHISIISLSAAAILSL